MRKEYSSNVTGEQSEKIRKGLKGTKWLQMQERNRKILDISKFFCYNKRNQKGVHMMKARIRLFRTRHPFDIPATDELFLEAIRENVSYHYAHCKPYQSILRKLHFSPDKLRNDQDLAKLPFLPTVLFKKHRLFSMSERRIPIKATSSGTKGQFSRIGLDWGSLLCGFYMVVRIAKWRGLFSFRPTNYVILGYQPHKSNQMAVMKTAYGATLFAPALHRCYALQYRDGSYIPDLESVIKYLEQFGKKKFPVRFMGFPSYTYFLLKLMDERNIRIPLPKHSKIMLGGGWKQFYTEQVNKQTLYDLIKRILDVDEENVIEFFGAVEHPILYCDCPKHHFHVLVYSRVIIRDVHTLEPVPNGTIGLVNLLTPMAEAVPITSIMTDDLGILHDGSKCSCGLESPYLEIIGRIGLKDIRTCAAGAAELLGGKTV